MPDVALSAALQRAQEMAHDHLVRAARQVLAAVQPVPSTEQILSDIAAAAQDRDARLSDWNGGAGEVPPMPVETIVAGMAERRPVLLAALQELARLLPHLPSDLTYEVLRAARERHELPASVGAGELTSGVLARILLRILVGAGTNPLPKLLAARRLRRLAVDLPTEPLLATVESLAGIGGLWPILRADVIGLMGQASPEVPSGTFEAWQQDDSPFVQVAAARVLLARGAPLTADYFLQLLEHLPSWLEREDIYMALASFGRSGTRDLIEQAHSTKASTRASGLWRLAALSAYVPADWIPDAPFLAALADPSLEIRAVAVGAAGVIGRPALLEQMVPALEDSERFVRFAALQALLDQPAVAPAYRRRLAAALVEALNDVNDTWREDGLKLAWRLGSDAPAEVMLSMLGDTNDDIRIAAAAALNRTHPDALRRIATDAAAILDEQPVTPPFDSLVQSSIALVIAHEPRTTLPMLEYAATLLARPFWEVRMYAA